MEERAILFLYCEPPKVSQMESTLNDYPG